MSYQFNHLDKLNELAMVMKDHGLIIIGSPICDGKIHRLRVQGDKKSARSGWYVVRDYPVLAAAFGNWRDGEKYTWSAVKQSELSRNQRRYIRKELQKAIAQHELEKKKEQEQVAKQCSDIFHSLPEAMTKHPYLLRKNVGVYGVRQKGRLLVLAVRNIDRDIISLQHISPDGAKYFATGGLVTGGFHLIGVIGEVIYICEGYATGATIYQKKGEAVIVAFNANNLINVAIEFRKQYPNLEIIIAADNDRFTPKNPGMKFARLAAEAVGGHLVFPVFPAGCDGTDFNDLALLDQETA